MAKKVIWESSYCEQFEHEQVNKKSKHDFELWLMNNR